MHCSIVHWAACFNIEDVTGNGQIPCCYNFLSGLFFWFISSCYLRADLWGRHLNLVGEGQVLGDSIFFSCMTFIQGCKGVETERWQGQPVSAGQIWTKRKTLLIIMPGDVLKMWDKFSVLLVGGKATGSVYVLSVSKKIKSIYFLITEVVFCFSSPQLFHVAHQYSTYSCFVEWDCGEQSLKFEEKIFFTEAE